MIPCRVSQINLGYVSIDSLYHEGEAVCVICPVMWSVVNEDLFMCFDGTCGTKVQPVVFRVPFCIFAVFIQRVIGKPP